MNLITLKTSIEVHFSYYFITMLVRFEYGLVKKKLIQTQVLICYKHIQ